MVLLPHHLIQELVQFFARLSEHFFVVFHTNGEFRMNKNRMKIRRKRSEIDKEVRGENRKRRETHSGNSFSIFTSHSDSSLLSLSHSTLLEVGRESRERKGGREVNKLKKFYFFPSIFHFLSHFFTSISIFLSLPQYKTDKTYWNSYPQTYKLLPLQSTLVYPYKNTVLND